MATSNFGDTNTLCTYAFGFCEYDETGAPDSEATDFSKECTIESVCEDLEKYGWEKYSDGCNVADKCFCTTDVERILGKYTTPLNCVGRYNNGSALYERAS